MNVNANKILFSIFGILIIIFVVFHTFSGTFDPYVTEEAIETTVDKTITTKCFLLRSESVVSSNYSGCKVYSVANGSKVANGSDIVKFYDNEQQVAKANEINELESFTNEIKEINEQNKIYSSDLNSLSAKINSSLIDLLDDVNNNRFSDISSANSKLRYYLSFSQLASRTENNYDSVISKCNNELNELKEGFNPEIQAVTAEKSGYFVNSVDGYENIVDYDKIDELSVSDIANLKPVKTESNQVGKIITENEWYIATVVDTNNIIGLSKGDKLTLKTQLSSIDELNVSIAQMNKDDASGKTALILSCMEMNNELASIRVKNMDVVINSYTGLRINSKALRMKNNNKGVYVLIAGTPKFRVVDVSYTTKEYVIVKTQNGVGQIKIYDDVIIKGKNIDG